MIVAVLGNSNLTYAYGAHSPKLENLIYCCSSVLNYFGGSPKVIVSDNLKAAVTFSDRSEPRINEAFHDMANYYNMAVIPARAGKPKDKKQNGL